HAVPDIEKERATLLFAVIANIDAGGELAADRFSHRFLRGGSDLAIGDRFVAALPDVQATQCVRPRQTAGVRDKNPVGARRHVRTMSAVGFKTVSGTPAKREGNPADSQWICPAHLPPNAQRMA